LGFNIKMENLSDPQTLYQDLLQTSFEKLKKGLPKKYKEINDMILTSIGLSFIKSSYLYHFSL